MVHLYCGLICVDCVMLLRSLVNLTLLDLSLIRFALARKPNSSWRILRVACNKGDESQLQVLVHMLVLHSHMHMLSLHNYIMLTHVLLIKHDCYSQIIMLQGALGLPYENVIGDDLLIFSFVHQ